MKLTIIKVLLCTFTLLAFVQNGTAQDKCSTFYPSKQGITWVIHQFDKRDKLSTIASYTLKHIAQGENGTTMTIAMRLIDGKNQKELTTMEFKAICDGNTTKLDPESLVAPGIFDQYKNMEYSITGSGLSFPNELKVGENLPDGDVQMAVDAGIMKINTAIRMTDRKVQSLEKVTTPAGTFDCFKITAINTLKMGMTQKNFSTQWIAEGVGLVQEETKKENGRLVSRSVLQSLE